MPPKELIKIENLSVNYDSRCVLENVNLSVFEGDFVGIIGPNGGGKSTLIKAILGLTPYSGAIFYEPSIAKNANIGYMPQQNMFDKAFPISVEEVILSGLQGHKGLLGRYSQKDKLKVEAIVEQLGIKNLKHKVLGELSGGEMQRTMLGRAIISEPQLLILDEPANFVDTRFENELYELLTELGRRMTIIMVSHDIAAIRRVANRVVCVNRAAHSHSPEELTPELLVSYHCPIGL